MAEQQHQFLEAMATQYDFPGDTRTVFLSRFDQVNANKENSVLVGFIPWNRQPEDKPQKLQDELKKICQVLEKAGCPISKPKRGRQPKGKSPWEQVFKWLWEEEFPKWQQRQNLDVPSEEEQKEAVCHFLKEIENNFKYDKLLHIPEQPIILKDQYIPIQVTLERKYTHAVETTWGYAESEAELKQAYALKGLEESQQSQVDWKEAKKQHQRIIVLADPGMGKSTLLRREAGLTAQEERQSLENNTKKLEEVVFPLFLRLSDLAETPEEIIDAIPALIQRKYSETATQVMKLLREKLKVGKCLLLLDALDEVPTEHRKRLFEKLNGFAQPQSPCPIICTSRIVGYSAAFVQGVKEVEIVPFSQKQIEQYIETWFRNAEGYLNDDTVSASSLIRELRNKPQIRGLAQNPLLLSLICSLYQEKGLTLPARRCQVYEQAVRYMHSKWSKKRNPELNDAWIDAKTELLEELAYQFSCDGKEIFTLRELRKTIDKYLQSGNASTDFDNLSASHLISELSEQDGILQTLHKDGDQYLFLHRTFQEYLTACYLNRARDGIALAKTHFWEYEWHEALSLLAGLLENPVPLLQAITHEKDDIFSTLLLLAGRCVAECQEVSHSLVEKIIDRIFELLCRYPSARFIQSVVVGVGQVNSQVIEKLQQYLSEEKSYVRERAIELLGEIGTPQAVAVLITALCRGNGTLSSSAAEALGKIGSPVAMAPLITALNNKESLVRWKAVEALGEMGSPEAVAPLITTLNDKEGFVRMHVPFALGKIDSCSAVEALITALSHEDGLVRWYAESTLGKIDTPEVVEALITALSCKDRRVRWYAVEALGKIGTSQAVEALITVALSDEEGLIRMNTVEALGKIATPQAVGSLLPALSDEDWDVRVSAAEALAKIGTPEAIASLITAIAHEDRRIRVRAALTLAPLGSSEAVTTLITTLSHEDWCFRAYAVEALGNIGTPEVVKALITALRDEEWRVRRYAAEALGNIGTPEVVKALITVLSDEEWAVRWYAAEALAKIGTPEIFAALITALSEENWRVRDSATKALGQIGTPEVVEALITVLNDENAEVRLNAVLALAKISSPEIVVAFITVLGDDDHRVRSNAIEALAKIGTSETLEKLIQLPEIDINRPDIFLLARTLAVRFSKERLPFIPVYPELVARKQ